MITLSPLFFVLATMAFISVVYADAPTQAVEVDTNQERIARWFYAGKLAEGTGVANTYV